MKEIHSFDFVANDVSLKSYKRIPHHREKWNTNVSEYKKYRMIIVEGDCSEQYGHILKILPIKINEKFIESKIAKGRFLDCWNIKEVVDTVYESDRSTINFFFVYIPDSLFLKELQDFIQNQNISFCYEELGVGYQVLISYDQDAYNQIKLAFFERTKVSDFYSIDLKMED